MNKIFFFTGTGNSFYLAKQLSEIINADLIPINNKMTVNNDLEESEIVGIIFPVYVFGPPLIVNDFLGKLNICNNTHLFIIATHGGYPGNTIQFVNKELKKRSIKLNAGYYVEMPDNYILQSDPPSQEKCLVMYKESTLEISNISKLILNKTDNIDKLKSKISDWFYTSILYKAVIKKLPDYSKKYTVDETCNLCKICVKICPKDNITIENDKLIWGENCEMCMACIQYCPEKAIQWSNKTQKRRRFQNSEITLKEMMKNNT